MIEMNVQIDHIHLNVSIPPKISVSQLMGILKGKTAIKIFKSYPQLKKKPYWGNHFWARGYCVDTIGLDEDKIKKYVIYQEKQERLEEQQSFDFSPLYLTAGISGGTSPICYNTAPGTFTASGSGGTGSYTYQWYTTSGMIIGATNVTYAPGSLAATTGYYCAVTSGSCGTVNTAATTITVLNNFTAGTILSSSETICHNGNPALIGSSADATGGDGTFSYKWQSSTDNLFTSPTDIANDAATYDPPAGLTTTTWYRRLAKDGTCNTSWNISAGIWQVTVSSIFLSGAIMTTGESLCFNGNPSLIGSVTPASGGSGTFSYQWQSSGNAGFTSPVDIANNALTYDPPSGLTATTWYRRQAKDGTPGAAWTSAAGTWQVSVTLHFVAGSASSDQTICYHATPAQITAALPSGGTSPYTCQWQSSTDNTTFQDISGSTGTGYQPGSLTQTTYYRQKQTSSAGCGQVFTPVVTITIHANSITAASLVNPLCKGASTTVMATGGSDYTWDQGLGSGPSKVVSPVANTTYTVTGTDNYGCSGIAASVTVTVTTLPDIQIAGSAAGSTGSSSTIALGSSENLTASGATTYLWNTGSTANPVTVTPTVATSYIVTGTTGNCSATVSHMVIVASVNAGPNQFICTGSSTTLTATSTGIVSPVYVWTLGNHSGASVTVSPAATTTYTVKANNLYFSTLTVYVNPKPVAEAGQGITIGTGSSGVLTGSVLTPTVAPYTYSWTNQGGSVISTAANATVNAAGTYNLVVTDVFGCASPPDNTTVTVTSSGVAVSGNVAYAFNATNNQMHDVTIALKQGLTTVYSTTTASAGNGNYNFPGVLPGTYTVYLPSSKPWGKVTATDITLIQNHYKTPGGTPLTGIKRLAADVVGNSSAATVNSVDRDTVNARRITPTITFSTGNWVFTRAADISLNTYPIPYANSAEYSDIILTVSGTAVVQDFRALCYGDMDASNTGLKDNEIAVTDFTTTRALDLVNIPNPFTQQTTIRFTVPVTGSVTVSVHSMLGLPVAVIADPDDYEGVHTLVFDAHDMAPGIYLYTVKLTTSDDVMIQTGKMMIVR